MADFEIDTAAQLTGAVDSARMPARNGATNGFLTPQQLRDRATHNGTQISSTISDFTEAAQDVVGALVAAAGGSYDDAAGSIAFPPSQASDATLTALAGLTGAGVVTATATDAFAMRAIGSASTTSIPDRAAADARYALLSGTTFTGRVRVTPVALTDAATIATDASLGNDFTVTLGGSRTLANPTNLAAGQKLTWVITQDGTGSRSLFYGNVFKWPGGVVPTLSTAAGAVDIISAYTNGVNVYSVITQAFG